MTINSKIIYRNKKYGVITIARTLQEEGLDPFFRIGKCDFMLENGSVFLLDKKIDDHYIIEKPRKNRLKSLWFSTTVEIVYKNNWRYDCPPQYFYNDVGNFVEASYVIPGQIVTLSKEAIDGDGIKKFISPVENSCKLRWTNEQKIDRMCLRYIGKTFLRT